MVHLFGGVPKKGLIRLIRIFPPNFSEKNRVLKLRFGAFSEGPGGFRELREAGRNHFHLSWYLSVPGVTSYDLIRKLFVFLIFFWGTFFLKKLGLDEGITSWELKIRIPRRKLRIYSYSQV